MKNFDEFANAMKAKSNKEISEIVTQVAKELKGQKIDMADIALAIIDISDKRTMSILRQYHEFCSEK